MNRNILFLSFLLITFYVKAQYIITDKDGYLNIREKPTAKSAIIDKILKYELFEHAAHFCINDLEDFTNIPSGWIPVCKELGSPIGYVYTRNILSLEKLPLLRPVYNKTNIVCTYDSLSIELMLKPFAADEHIIEYDELGNTLVSIDNQFPKGLYSEDFFSTSKEITGLRITCSSDSVDLTINDIKDYYNPRMSVTIGPEGELYIHISCGDGGEVYQICLSVVNGEIKFVRDTSIC